MLKRKGCSAQKHFGRLSTLVLLFFAMVMQALGQVKESPPKIALLIGINKYRPGSEIRALNGTNNDVRLMTKLLTETYNFKHNPKSPSSDIKILLNTQATRDAIRLALKNHLFARAKTYAESSKASPQDGATIVFYFSGHGGKLVDKSGDEFDELDETIIPFDSNKDGARDIIDDEFDVFLEEIKQYTTNITFIFDSCHSGTVTRGGVDKSVPRDLPAVAANRSNRLADAMPRGETYVTVSSSLPNELSQEDVFFDPDTKKGQWNGALTFGLYHLLRREPSLTYREAMQRVQAKIVALNKGQTPQAEGAIDRMVFGAPVDLKGTPILVESQTPVRKALDKDRPDDKTDLVEIKFKAGSIVGAGNGAAIGVFGRKKGSELIEQIGSGVVVDPTDDFSATAEVTLEASVKEIPEGAFVVILSPSFSTTGRQKVGLEKSAAGSEIVDMVQKGLTGNSLIEVVETKNVLKGLAATRGSDSESVARKLGDWRTALVRAKYRDFVDLNPAETEVPKPVGKMPVCGQKRYYGDKPDENDEGFMIVNRVGQPLYGLWYSAKDPEAGQCLLKALISTARLERFRSLDQSNSAIGDGVGVELVRLKRETFKVVSRITPLKCSYEAVSDEEVAADRNQTLRLSPGDKFFLKITNNSQIGLYFYVYSLTTAGRINMLYPFVDGLGTGERFLPGQTLVTHSVSPSYGNCFILEVEPLSVSPAGFETLKIIATAEPFPGRLLEQDSISKGTRGGGLSEFLAQAVTGTRTGRVEIRPNDVAIKNINFEIVPAPARK